ncbi:type VII secretion protein EccE [Actinophytocola sp.]|uniref:type VII secretion protein EccE n=1 Tax=Actinophytocola sp. TaxID=1872138 RepID=UPI002ED34ABB
MGWLLPLGAGRVVAWQVAVLAVLATGFRVTPVSVTVMALAGLLVAMTSVRVGGLCGYQWAVVFARFVWRRRRSPAKAPTPVHTVVPRLQVFQHEDRVGNRTGIACVGEDTIAVVRVAPAAHPDPALLVSLLHKAVSRTDYPVSGARLVVWAVPANPWPVRVHWLALRYRAADAPWAALARGGGDVGCRKAVAGAAQRLVSDLAGAGCASAVLDLPELCQELMVALGVSSDAQPVEAWHDWSAGPVHQSCFTARAPADAVTLLGRCVPEAMFTATAYSLSRDTPHATATVRLAVASNQRFWLTPRKAAAKVGIRLLAADGRQAEGVLATLPLA